ncbi:15025_t:CDS:2 [Gigaspora rosea]|nr:15025_t:CDS:2 [Gigaspora rosea]
MVFLDHRSHKGIQISYIEYKSDENEETDTEVIEFPNASNQNVASTSGTKLREAQVQEVKEEQAPTSITSKERRALQLITNNLIIYIEKPIEINLKISFNN